MNRIPLSRPPLRGNTPRFHAAPPGALVAALLAQALAGPVGAQAPAAPPELLELPPVVVTGTAVPRAADELVVPVTVLAADAIHRSGAPTLGELLAGSPGLHGSAFAAGSSRPVIRGFEGARVRVLSGGLDAGDVSDTSPDHAVGIDPLFAGSVEVVRGSATLLHGSQAIGGVVNVVDRRVAAAGLARPMAGEAVIRHDGVSRGWTGGLLASAGGEQVVATASLLRRDHGDHRIPVPAESEALHDEHDDPADPDHHDEEPFTGRLEGSFARVDARSLGLAFFPAEGTRAWAGFQAMDSLYGVPGHAHEEEHDPADPDHDDHGEEGVAIDLRSRRFDAGLERSLGEGFLRSVRAQGGRVDYAHLELEGDEVGTSFARDTIEARAEALYALGDDLPGVAGAQWLEADFDAEGAEAFVPASTTRDRALFLLQEWRLERLRLEAGGRLERRSIDAGAAGAYGGTAGSLSAGLHARVAEGRSVAVSLTRSERHPTATELFADGPHAATRQFEVGDATLGIEAATGIDLTWRSTGHRFTTSVSGFATEFDDFVALRPTGAEEDELPVFAYGAEDARFVGAEAEVTWHAVHAEGRAVHVTFLGDLVRARSTSGGGDLPRIPAARLGARLDVEEGPWRWFASALHAFRQDRVAVLELPTGDWTRVDAGVSRRLDVAGIELEVSAAVRNLLDEEIRDHVSALKDLAPRPGRGVEVSALLRF